MQRVRSSQHVLCNVVPVCVREMHPAARKLTAAVACLVYMTISSALIVLNKQLMSGDGFRYPMALSGLGMGFSAMASYIACKVICISPSAVHDCANGWLNAWLGSSM